MGKVEERIRVVVVSPGDVTRERAVVQAVVDELNRGVAGARGCRLSLWRWEIDARPGMHRQGPQGLIDERMGIQSADVAVGVFWKRFGTPTGGADSGTEYELRRAWAAWQQQGRPEVMVYFCTRAYSPKTPDELAQWQRVLEFQQAQPEQQLWWRYTTVAKFERLLREHLTALVLARGALPEPRRPPRAADVQRPFPLPSALAAGAEDVLVGRTADLEALDDVFAEAAGGARQLVLLCGEPGIGKTRLATECALRAHDDGAIVLYGRCDEEALLALQPFVGALRHYVDVCPVQELAQRLGSVSGELRRMLPELADRIAHLAEPLAGDPEGARSRLFEAIGALLCEAAQSTPVVLVLEDLHWADEATLLLLKYLIRYPREARLMVLGTYRETELDIDHPLSRMLTELGRKRLVKRRQVEPLDAAAVSQLVDAHAGDATSPELRRIVYEGTEGNAFFVVEVLRDLVESGAIREASTQPNIAAGRLAVPESVKDVIGQRLARLGPETIRLLIMAAVLGRRFELDVLQHLSELEEDDLLDGLDSAVRARVIEEVAGAAGRFMFSHALIRETLYGGLTASRRALLHRRAGAALEQAHGEDTEPFLADLAYHFAQAASSANLDKAIEYGTRAGEHAISLAAYEQAAAHFRQTVELIDATDPDQRPRQRCDLTIAQGEAERQAGDPGYRETLFAGAELAQQLGDADRLARAALANNRGFFSATAGVDRERVALLTSALAAQGADDSITHASLLGNLAVELVADPDWANRSRLSDDALAMARRLSDVRTLVRTLNSRYTALWGPRTVGERLANSREADRLATQLGDPVLGFHASHLGSHAAMEAGDLQLADRLLPRAEEFANQLGQPIIHWYIAITRAKRSSIAGSLDEAERLAYVALAVGRASGQMDAFAWFASQLVVIRFLQGALDRRRPNLLEAARSSAPYDAAGEPVGSRSVPRLNDAIHALTLSEVGYPNEARNHFDKLMSDELRDLPHDWAMLAIPAMASVTCANLADSKRAERLHAMLEPHASQFVDTGPSWFGAANHYLALLASALDRPDEADARFADAAGAYERLGADAWLARAWIDWSMTLMTRRGARDMCQSRRLLRQARDAARALGLSAVEHRAAALAAELDA